ncbi:MAG: diguanylate cyclase [Eubacterium sp.]|nr:diguanylate cyclase [Eubacterium sp.]
METNLKNSLRGKMLLSTLVPIIILGVAVMIVAFIQMKATLIDEFESDMRQQCLYMMAELNEVYPGNFSVEILNDTTYKLYKGEYDITEDNTLIDSLKESFGNEYSIFRGNICVKTTMTDSSGERWLLTESPNQAYVDVYEGNQTAFYKNLTMNDQQCIALFVPIHASDNSVFGMIAIYRSLEDLNKKVITAVLPMLIVFAIITVLIAFYSIYSSQKIVKKIKFIERFMNQISNGHLEAQLPETILNSDDEISLLAKSGNQMRYALEQLVNYDTLTKLPNRRYGGIHLKNVFLNSGQGANDFCVAIGDIDFFKKVNDSYGHDAGDAVLREVAAILKRNMIGKAFVARWGGEEFLFVFEGMNLASSKQKLEETLMQIRNHTVEHNFDSLKVTMSFGVTQAFKDSSIDELLQIADTNLYVAKENGRNQIFAK